MRQLLRDALEETRAADATPDAAAEPVKAKLRVEPVADEAGDPEDLVEELERAVRRGEKGD
jgi:hypothetical protein